MRTSRIAGSACIVAAVFVLAAVFYEPANIAGLLGVQNSLDEASVVLLSVLVAVALGIAGARRFAVRNTLS